MQGRGARHPLTDSVSAPPHHACVAHGFLLCATQASVIGGFNCPGAGGAAAGVMKRVLAVAGQDGHSCGAVELFAIDDEGEAGRARVALCAYCMWGGGGVLKGGAELRMMQLRHTMPYMSTPAAVSLSPPLTTIP